MQRDLASLYPLYQPTDLPMETASTTATSTISLGTFHAAPARARTRFEDGVIANHDVRILYDTDGRTLLLYGYTPDKTVLIIARDEAAFRTILGRLRKGS